MTFLSNNCHYWTLNSFSLYLSTRAYCIKWFKSLTSQTTCLIACFRFSKFIWCKFLVLNRQWAVYVLCCVRYDEYPVFQHSWLYYIQRIRHKKLSILSVIMLFAQVSVLKLSEHLVYKRAEPLMHFLNQLLNLKCAYISVLVPITIFFKWTW